MTRLLAAVSFSLLMAAPALAQITAPGPDELLALNFYAQQQDTDSVNAELRRLRLKYPQWTPPEDLSRIGVTAPSTEIDAFYRQVAEGHFDEARETLAQARLDYPEWEPAAEMTDLLETAEGQVLLDAALDEVDIASALRIAAGAPGLLRCDRINNAWRIAEAQQDAGNDSEALGTYRAVLSACINPSDLLATLEKVDAVASEAELRALFTQVTTRVPDRADDFSLLQRRLLAGRGADPAPHDSAGTGGARPQPRPAGIASRATAKPAAPSSSPAQSRQASASPAPSAGASSDAGLAPANDWAGCLRRAAGSSDAAVIYQRGWCAYNLERPMEAVADFQTALSGRLNATQRRDAAYGIALAYLKMHMPEEAARISAATDFTQSQRVDVERQILDQRGVAAYENRQYQRAIQYFDALEQLAGSMRRDLAILRAYAYLNLDDRIRARAEFQRLNEQLSTRETREGLAASRD